MAAFHCGFLISNRNPLWRWRDPDVTQGERSEACCAVDSVVRARLGFTSDCARFSTPRTWRATLLDSHDAARNPDADFGATARTRPPARSLSVGIASIMASAHPDRRSLKRFQDILVRSFFTILGMVTVSHCVVDLAYSLAIRQNSAERLDSRGATYDLPAGSTAVLVAVSESHVENRLRWRIGVRIHDSIAYQYFGSAPHICASTLVFVLHNNCARLASHRARRSTTRRIDHVDSGGNAVADCCPRPTGQVDEPIADSMAIHANGGTRWLVRERHQVRTTLFLISIVLTLSVGCDRLTHTEVRRAAALTGGGNARMGRTEIRKYGCNACHEISGVPGARGLIGPRLDGVSQRYYIAGELPNTPDNLMLWIQHPRQVESHTAMPEMGVTEQDSRDIAAYLYTLR